jgi:hypothetical protein
MGDSLRASEYLMNQMAGGGDAAILDYAHHIEQAQGDKVKIAALTKAIYTPTLWDKFYEYWINAILSGPLTHAANIIGNGFFLGTETAAHGIAAATGRESLAEFTSRVGAMTHGVFEGLKNAKEAFITENPQLDANTQFDYGRRKAIESIHPPREPLRRIMASILTSLASSLRAQLRLRAEIHSRSQMGLMS